MQMVNITNVSKRKCAFCQHWYDPTNAAIRLKTNIFWEFDEKKKNRCLHYNTERPAFASCQHFEFKL